MTETMETEGWFEAKTDKIDPTILAEGHVAWFLNLVRPLLITNFIHGFEHGCKSRDYRITSESRNSWK